MSADHSAATTIFPPRLHSVTEAARLIGVSRSHLYAMKAAGLIRFGKLLNKTVVTDNEIERVIASVNEVGLR